MDVLLEAIPPNASLQRQSFNPYCNGCTSRSEYVLRTDIQHCRVSILIVMDVLLEVLENEESSSSCFNPYCNGSTSRSILGITIYMHVKFQSLL